MSCCCPGAACPGTGKFFGRAARRYRKRFKKKGLEPSQQNLMQQIVSVGVEGCTLIEPGCGVGFFHHELLRRGAKSALGIDLSEKMLDEAQSLARDDGLADRCTYRVGDFVQLASECDRADLVILDKVICCYPDFPALVDAAAEHAQRAVAFTIPRWRWLTRAAFVLFSLAELVFKCRAYVHSPDAIDERLRTAGFTLHSEGQTTLWLTRTYTRA